MENTYCVYCHTNLCNGKQYVGITKQRPQARWKSGKGYVRNKHFYSAIEKYGWDGFSHEILFDKLELSDAEELEKKLIKQRQLTNSKYGYNQDNGGMHGRDRVSESTRLKLSQIGKGHTVSQETRDKISQKCSNPSEEIRKRLSESAKRTSDERRERMIALSQKQKGENHPMYGKKHSEESIRKMSESHKGRIQGREEREKHSIGTRKWECKRVIQLEKDGTYVATYDAIIDASKVVGVNYRTISEVLHGRNKTAGGYRWEFE